MRRSQRLRFGPSRHSVGTHRAPAGNHIGVPTVVLVHGGFWRWPYNRWVMCLLQRDLTRRGWGSFNIDYRRLGRFGGGGGWPQTFDDVRAGIDLMTSGNGPTTVDPRCVFVVGHSAGAQLALVAAAQLEAAHDTVAPSMVISMSGPTDLERLLQNGSEPVAELTRDAPVDDRWVLTSPMHMLPIGVRTRCVHGAADTTVSPDSSRRFAAAAAAAGDDSDVVIVADEAHRDALLPSSSIWETVVTIIAAAAVPETQV